MSNPLDRFRKSRTDKRIGASKSRIISDGDIRNDLLGIDDLLTEYAKVDVMAIHYQRSTNRVLFLLIGLGVIAMVGYESYVHKLPAQPLQSVGAVFIASCVSALFLGIYFFKFRDWVIIGGTVLFVATAIFLIHARSFVGHSESPAPRLITLGGFFASIVFALSSFRYFIAHKRIHEHYVNYRALAELLRVRIFWVVGAIEDDESLHALGVHESKLNLSLETTQEHKLALPDSTRFDIVTKHWLEDQVNFFGGHTATNYQLKTRTHDWAVSLAYIALLYAVLLMVVDDSGNYTYEAMVFTLGLLPPLGAALGAYGEFKGFAINARRYAKMQGMFSSAKSRITEYILASNFEAARHELSVLGRIALDENSEWAGLHRDRPPHPLDWAKIE